jgi:hypothetical protein
MMTHYFQITLSLDCLAIVVPLFCLSFVQELVDGVLSSAAVLRCGLGPLPVRP